MGIQHYIALYYTSAIEVHPPFHAKRDWRVKLTSEGASNLLKRLEMIPRRGSWELPYLLYHFLSSTGYFCMAKCLSNRKKYIILYLSNRGLFLCFYSLRGELGEFETVMQTQETVESLHSFLEFSQPPRVKMRLCQCGKKVLYCPYEIFFSGNTESDFSSKHTYQPMRAYIPS